jgi:hypothetical protein
MTINQLTNPIVKAAVEAMNARDRAAWFEQFAPDAILTDDGNPHDFTEWSDTELFGESRAYVTAVDRTEDEGRTLYTRFHSDQWGDFKSFMRFTITGDKITRLDVGQIE